MMFFFNDDKSKVDAEAYISNAINNLNTTLRDLINQKSDKGHKHSAADIVSGVLDVLRIPDLSASKITSDSLPVARGGTGASNANDARMNLNAVGKHSLIANYSGSVVDNPDILVKTFSYNINNLSDSDTVDIDVTVSGYHAITVSSFVMKPINSGNTLVAQLDYTVEWQGQTNKFIVSISPYHIVTWPQGGITCKFDVVYLRTSIVNQ